MTCPWAAQQLCNCNACSCPIANCVIHHTHKPHRLLLSACKPRMGFTERLTQLEKSTFSRMSAEVGYLLPHAGPLSVELLSQQACRDMAAHLRLKATMLTKKSSGERPRIALALLQCRLLKLVASILSERAPWQLCQVSAQEVANWCLFAWNHMHVVAYTCPGA